MARRNKVEGDPMVACSLRLHQSLVARIEKEARESKLGRSDYLRQIIQKYDTGSIKLTNRPTPIKRRPSPVSVPRPIDPALVSAVVSCGNSLNQLASGVCAADFRVEASQLLLVLSSIDQKLTDILELHAS